MVILKDSFEKVNFEKKNQQITKIHEMFPGMQKELNSLHNRSLYLTIWNVFSSLNGRQVKHAEISRSKRKFLCLISMFILSHILGNQLLAECSGGAYRIVLTQASIHPSVCPSVFSYFQAWISLRPAGRLELNFIWGIIGVGERLHMVLDQIGS